MDPQLNEQFLEREDRSGDRTPLLDQLRDVASLARELHARELDLVGQPRLHQRHDRPQVATTEDRREPTLPAALTDRPHAARVLRRRELRESLDDRVERLPRLRRVHLSQRRRIVVEEPLAAAQGGEELHLLLLHDNSPVERVIGPVLRDTPGVGSGTPCAKEVRVIDCRAGARVLVTGAPMLVTGAKELGGGTQRPLGEARLPVDRPR